MGYVFIGACFYREILLWEGMVVLGLFLCMLYTLYLTKQDPGSIRPGHSSDPYARTLTVPKGSLSHKAYPTGDYSSITAANGQINMGKYTVAYHRIAINGLKL